MRLVNLTPHQVTVGGVTVPPDGRVCRGCGICWGRWKAGGRCDVVNG
jgi:hypothetical protein